jgi:hypothetical protein
MAMTSSSTQRFCSSRLILVAESVSRSCIARAPMHGRARDTHGMSVLEHSANFETKTTGAACHISRCDRRCGQFGSRVRSAGAAAAIDFVSMLSCMIISMHFAGTISDLTASASARARYRYRAGRPGRGRVHIIFSCSAAAISIHTVPNMQY